MMQSSSMRTMCGPILFAGALIGGSILSVIGVYWVSRLTNNSVATFAPNMQASLDYDFKIHASDAVSVVTKITYKLNGNAVLHEGWKAISRGKGQVLHPQVVDSSGKEIDFKVVQRHDWLFVNFFLQSPMAGPGVVAIYIKYDIINGFCKRSGSVPFDVFHADWAGEWNTRQIPVQESSFNISFDSKRRHNLKNLCVSSSNGYHSYGGKECWDQPGPHLSEIGMVARYTVWGVCKQCVLSLAPSLSDSPECPGLGLLAITGMILRLMLRNIAWIFLVVIVCCLCYDNMKKKRGYSAVDSAEAALDVTADVARDVARGGCGGGGGGCGGGGGGCGGGF